MKIKLTDNQIKLVKNRIKENLKEEQELLIKDKKNEPVNGWDFAALSNERYELEYVIKTKHIQF